MIFELHWQVQHNLAFSLFFKHILFSFTICFSINFFTCKNASAYFLTKLKTKSETSSSTLQVQFKEISNEDVGQDETLSDVIAVLETNYYNSDIENIVEEVYTAVNM
jgi:hypothetical protein